ncbi:hypothetical protein WICMUC_003258 [Wickerhamomyces mucosus]|uniref:ENTH domain-containing protein n=1 Tax=Wickerhamomyces mucosus TaxID=1378264 RepID=A0A9P8TDL5_9ASCO|nr:hypothetical protein WICMUC_003258 [Wickerhamomyces mucosus]
MSRRLVRSIRNISSTPIEIKIKSATSNDSFGPTATELNDIAILTSSPESLRQIIQVLTKRLNDSSRNWRHVLKSLTVIQFCMLAGSLDFVLWIRSNSYLVKTLKEFQLKGNEELAQQIRLKASNISQLIKDKELLEKKRSNFHIFRSKMSQPATNQRSSLDISRDTENLRSTQQIPINIPLRNTQSLDIKRETSNWNDDNNSNPSKRFWQTQDDVSKFLANISEE